MFCSCRHQRARDQMRCTGQSWSQGPVHVGSACAGRPRCSGDPGFQSPVTRLKRRKRRQRFSAIRMRSLNEPRQGSLPTVQTVTPLRRLPPRHLHRAQNRRIRPHPPTNSDSCSTGYPHLRRDGCCCSSPHLRGQEDVSWSSMSAVPWAAISRLDRRQTASFTFAQ